MVPRAPPRVDRSACGAPSGARVCSDAHGMNAAVKIVIWYKLCSERAFMMRASIHFSSSPSSEYITELFFRPPPARISTSQLNRKHRSATCSRPVLPAAATQFYRSISAGNQQVEISRLGPGNTPANTAFEVRLNISTLGVHSWPCLGNQHHPHSLATRPHKDSYRIHLGTPLDA